MLAVGDCRRALRRACQQGRAARGGWVAVALLAGCQGSLQPAWEPQPIAASQSVIRFEHEDFDPARSEYRLQHDPRSDNEVHLGQFAGNGVFATLAAYKTGPSFVIEERSTESYVAHLLGDAQLTWGESGRTATRYGSVPYRMFKIAGQPFDCVGFGQPRGESSDDRGRKSDLLFGYFCQSDARPLTAARATDLIGGLALSARR